MANKQLNVFKRQYQHLHREEEWTIIELKGWFNLFTGYSDSSSRKE